jgi:hypothetical protein
MFENCYHLSKKLCIGCKRRISVLINVTLFIMVYSTLNLSRNSAETQQEFKKNQNLRRNSAAIQQKHSRKISRNSVKT